VKNDSTTRGTPNVLTLWGRDQDTKRGAARAEDAPLNTVTIWSLCYNDIFNIISEELAVSVFMAAMISQVRPRWRCHCPLSRHLVLVSLVMIMSFLGCLSDSLVWSVSTSLHNSLGKVEGPAVGSASLNYLWTSCVYILVSPAELCCHVLVCASSRAWGHLLGLAWEMAPKFKSLNLTTCGGL
jgi:hypothetical protein